MYCPKITKLQPCKIYIFKSLQQAHFHFCITIMVLFNDQKSVTFNWYMQRFKKKLLNALDNVFGLMYGLPKLDIEHLHELSMNYLGVGNILNKEYLLYPWITWNFAVDDTRFGWSLTNNLSVCYWLDLTVLTYFVIIKKNVMHEKPSVNI